MAKISFTKLGLKPETEVQVFEFNEQAVEIKKYLSFEDKMRVISQIINQSIDGNGYYNPMRVELFTTLEIMFAYTNINFTDKMKSEPLKLYDTLVSSGFYQKVIDIIEETEIESINTYVQQTIHNIYEYRNSAMGIMDIITADYSNLSLDAQHINETLSNPENLSMLREVLTKLG